MVFKFFRLYGLSFDSIRYPCRNMKCIHKGFSFMEVLFVLCAIVAISSGAFVVGGHVLTTGKYNAAKTDVAAISMAVAQYKFEIGSMPSSLTALTVAQGQYGPWLPSGDLEDPWGNDYSLVIVNNHEYVVMSNGADGANNKGYEGGTTDDIFIKGIY